MGRPRKQNTYDLSNQYGIGYTSKGQIFYFDLEDYEKIKNYCWTYHKSRNKYYLESRDRNNYNIILKMHRLVIGATNKEEIVDHINNNSVDNRKQNLRITDNSGNSKNRKERKDNTTGYNGVSLRKDTGKYRVRIGIDYKEITVGQFSSLEEAIECRKKSEKEIYAQYARKD